VPEHVATHAPITSPMSESMCSRSTGAAQARPEGTTAASPPSLGCMGSGATLSVTSVARRTLTASLPVRGG